MAIHRRSGSEIEDLGVLPRFTQAGMLEVPKNRLSEREMLPQTAYQIVRDEVMLDGNARFNLASFVTTWMEEEADKLYAATVCFTLGKGFSHDMAELFLRDLRNAMEWLDGLDAPMPHEDQPSSFHH